MIAPIELHADNTAHADTTTAPITLKDQHGRGIEYLRISVTDR